LILSTFFFTHIYFFAKGIRRLFLMILKRLVNNWWFNGWLLILMVLFAPHAFAELILSTPAPNSENMPYSEVGLWWRYDEDWTISAQIQEQVQRVWLRVYEVSQPSDYRGDYVGDCSASFPCSSCGMQYNKWLSPRTFASTAECGEGGSQLKMNQWYKWSLKVDFQDGSSWIKSAAFKTADYRDIIIDDSSAGFTVGPGPVTERTRGYNNSSLLVETISAEDETNYCQWEWTIPEERDYEVSVYLPITSYGGNRLGTSKQAQYELWREGIPTPIYQSTKLIDQTVDYHNLWASLGTHHFKAGQAKLKLSNNTGEPTPLGRQLVCDAVRVRKRLGTPQLSPLTTQMPSLRRRVREGSSSMFLSPMKNETILSSRAAIEFNWVEIPNATSYRLQISLDRHFGDAIFSEWLQNLTVASNDTTVGSTFYNTEVVKTGQQCDAYCINAKISNNYHTEETSRFQLNTPYYWRIRVENEEDGSLLSMLQNFGQWSDTYQFLVIEDPVTKGALSITSQDLYQEKGILFENNKYTFENQDIRIDPSTQRWAFQLYPNNAPVLKYHPVWVRIWYSDTNYTERQMPIVLFIHGNHPNCQGILDGNEISYMEIGGVNGKRSSDFPVGTVFPTEPQRKIEEREEEYCQKKGGEVKDDENGDNKIPRKIPSHQGYDYLLQKLASHGLFAISINTHDLQGVTESWVHEARAELILKFLDKLRDWNEKGTDPWNGIFQGKLDLSKIGLSGHSMGGPAVVTALSMNSQRNEETRHSIVAINAIAPMDGEYKRTALRVNAEATFFLLQGALDGDIVDLQGVRLYDRSYGDQIQAKNRQSKMMAYVYGANHNYFNTIWTPKAGNDWIAQDDATEVVKFTDSALQQRITAEEQQQVTLTSILAFFRWQLLNQNQYQALFTGNYKHKHIYWAYQDVNHLMIDNFEQNPNKQNQLGGQNTLVGESILLFEEQLLHRKEGISSYYSSSRPTGISQIDMDFFHDTKGLRLDWQVSNDSKIVTYRTQIPTTDASGYHALNLRVANKEMAISQSYQETLSLAVTLISKTPEDELVKSNTVQTNQFQRIPYRYGRGTVKSPILQYPVEDPIVMTDIRIPLKEFFPVNSEELKNIVEIQIAGTGQRQIGLDDIAFTY
jgi:hypothetical protein